MNSTQDHTIQNGKLYSLYICNTILCLYILVRCLHRILESRKFIHVRNKVPLKSNMNFDSYTKYSNIQTLNFKQCLTGFHLL